MVQDKFRVRFYRKIGKDEDPHEYKDVLISYDSLKEGLGEKGTKPPNTFAFKRGQYLFDPTKSKTFDSKGRPIYRYLLGNSGPMDDLPSKTPGVKDENGKWTEIDSTLLDKTFSRGEMKSVIAGAQKESGKFDWMNLLVGALMSAPVAFIVGALLHAHIGIP